LTPQQQPAYVSAKLPEALSGSHLNYWRLDDSVPNAGCRTLIGIAPYALPDLQLLDSLERALSKKSNSAERIDVLDVLTCTTTDDFERCLPGVGRVFQTPVVGFWKNGNLKQEASGAPACQLIIRRYDLDWKK
jgi:hypothetical protein